MIKTDIFALEIRRNRSGDQEYVEDFKQFREVDRKLLAKMQGEQFKASETFSND